MTEKNKLNEEEQQQDGYKEQDQLVLFGLSYRIMQLYLVLFIGIGVGYLYFVTFTNYANNCSVAFISANKIVSLEKERVKALLSRDKDKDLDKDISNDKERYLFFNQTEEALMLMDKIGRSYENKKTKVLFVKDDFVKGTGLVDISEQVHKQIITKLALSEQATQEKQHKK